MVHRLSCSGACGIILDQGSNPSPALAGRSFTTEPPWRPWDSSWTEDSLGRQDHLTGSWRCAETLVRAACPSFEKGHSKDTEGPFRYSSSWLEILFLVVPCSFWVLAPRPKIQPVPSSVKAQSPSHWTTTGFPRNLFIAGSVKSQASQCPLRKSHSQWISYWDQMDVPFFFQGIMNSDIISLWLVQRKCSFLNTGWRTSLVVQLRLHLPM